MLNHIRELVVFLASADGFVQSWTLVALIVGFMWTHAIVNRNKEEVMTTEMKVISVVGGLCLVLAIMAARDVVRLDPRPTMTAISVMMVKAATIAVTVTAFVTAVGVGCVWLFKKIV